MLPRTRLSPPTAEAVQTPTQGRYLVGGRITTGASVGTDVPTEGAMASLGAVALECGWPQSIQRCKETHDRRRAPHPPTCTGTHAQDPQPSLLPGGLQAHEASPAGISPVRRRRIYHRTARSLEGDYNAQNLTYSRGRRRRGRLCGASVAVWVVEWSKL